MTLGVPEKIKLKLNNTKFVENGKNENCIEYVIVHKFGDRVTVCG